MHKASIFAAPQKDLIAGIVVFLVALPLCLGIAVACGVPPISGLIAGAIGGLVVPLISRAPLSVSGPAAGLTSIVLLEVGRIGLNQFLAAVVFAGVIQFVFGAVRAGRFSALVPSPVIKGMLAAIGITIVYKQLPVAFGFDGKVSEIPARMEMGSALLAALSLFILYGWKHTPLAKFRFLSPALVVVVLTSVLAASGIGLFSVSDAGLVNVPLGGISGLLSALPRPDFAGISSADFWVAAATVAVVASIETLLSIQAVDRLDPLRRHSPPDRELLAQGVANTLSGLAGGLPVTSVIVRSGANVAAGGVERLSALFHGVLLLTSVLVAGPLLNKIPLAGLAAVLIQVGLNLCRPSMFLGQFRLGISQLLPFLATITAVLALDLLKGVIVGMILGVVFVLQQNVRDAVVKDILDDGVVRLKFRRDATFLTKPALMSYLDELDDGARVVIDATGEFVDHDVKEALATFLLDAPHRRLQVSVVGLDLAGVGAGGGH